MPHDRLKGIFFCLIATVSWGTMFPVMTGALQRIDPFTFTSLRYLSAGSAFLALLLLREGSRALSLKGERVLPAWLFGTAGFAGFGFLVFLGQQMAGREGALTASIMMATMPLLGLLVNWVIRKAMPPAYSFLFIAVSFCGVALVVTKGRLGDLADQPLNYRADALIVLGALCWVIYTAGAVFYPTWSALRYTTVTTWLGLTSVVTLNAALLASGVVPIPSAAQIASVAPHLAYMVFIAGFVGVLCWNVGNRILSPLTGVLFADVVPITAFAVSAIEGVVPSTMQIVGACLSCVALVCNNVYLRHSLARPKHGLDVTPPPPSGSRSADGGAPAASGCAASAGNPAPSRA